jgi:hypothetical protein
MPLGQLEENTSTTLSSTSSTTACHAWGLDNNFASDRGCNSTTTTSTSIVDTILRQQLDYVIVDYGRADHAAPDKS